MKMSQAEKVRFLTLHPTLQFLVEKVKDAFDVPGAPWIPFIVSAHRTQAAQDDCVRRKVSKCVWPRSSHNQYPSLAVDLMALGNDGELIDDVGLCTIIANEMELQAKLAGLPPPRWGGNFKTPDCPHWELAAEWDRIKRNHDKLIQGATKK